MRTIHVVSHTHWDREWYHPAERFRVRLVELIDELLDDPAGTSAGFLLDGQAVVLDDYLDVRPERRGDLAAALKSGALEAGPWFVLADELIPGGEGLVRNLLAGRRRLQDFGVDSPPVLYCPDSFGHPAALPELAQGFAKPMVILWRGFGSDRWPRGNAFRWRSAGGTESYLYPLTRSGYELGSSLPASHAAARERWRDIASQYAPRATVGVELLLNGADHHARQRHLPAAIEALRAVMSPDKAKLGSLTDFARAFLSEAETADLPGISGELRDSYGFTWTLQGTFGTRAPQKRRYAASERSMVRDVEPWLAFASFQGGRSTEHLTRAAWRSLLLCQPHDTLCGCSIDTVARAMDARLDAVEAQSAELRQNAIERIVGHDREAARSRSSDWMPTAVIRNRAPRSRSGVALVEVVLTLGDVPVGPGSAPAGRRKRPQTATAADIALTHERTESPRAYPDNDAVARFHSAVWVDNVPAYGLATIPLSDVAALSRPAPEPVRVQGRSMHNGRLSLRWNARGQLTLEDHRLGRSVPSLLAWESREDRGDLYTPSIRAPKLKARLLATQVIARGPLTAVLEQRWRLALKRDQVDVQLRLVLDAGASFLRFGVLGDNAARDHRLRLVLSTDVRKPRVFADAAFGPVERVPLRVPREQRSMEAPPGTDPLHRYVSLFDAKRGATLFSDGLTEYEARNGSVAVTLLRSVGELSRNDLPERPGHAGWPEPTPEAQCIGPFEAEFGLLLHGPRTPAAVHEIEQTADDVLFPLTGETLRSVIEPPQPFHGVELEGAGLALSCIKETERDGWLVLRCVNLFDEAVEGRWRLGRTVREAALARLDETPTGPLTPRGNDVAFSAPPRGIVTILLR